MCGIGKYSAHLFLQRYPISIEGAVKYWREDILVQRKLYPEITANCVIAWRRNIPYSQAVNKMIEEINAFQA